MSTAQNAHHNPVLEVAQTVGSTVDSVHLISASESKPKISRKLLIGIGLACLLLSGLAFGRGVSVAAKNDRALHQWVAEKRAHHEFRPEQLSLAHDFVAFGGLLAALGCFGGALAIRRRRPSVIRAGRGSDDQIAWEHPSFELATVTEGAATITLPIETVATVTSADGEQTEKRGTIILSQSESASVETGLGAIHFRWTEKPRPAPIAAFSFESRTAKFIAVSAVAHLAVLGLLLLIPPDARAMHNEMIGADDNLRHVVVAPVEDPATKPDTGNTSGEKGAANTVTAGAQTSSAKGDRGDPKATRERTRAAIPRRSDTPQLARPSEPRDMRNVGINSLLSEDTFVAFNSPNDFASGHALDAMYGNDFNADGSGPGFGNGGDWGTPDGQGISPYDGNWGPIRSGKIPGGPTGPEGYGPSWAGDGTLTRGHKKRQIYIKPKPVNCGVAGCDKALIGRYIRKQKRRIRNCYERALLTAPKLAGTVNTHFLIHANGSVTGVKASGIGNKPLESCIAGVVKSIRFPVVADGAIAAVKYPFHLAQSGQ